MRCEDMKRAVAGLAAACFLLGSVAACADTALVHVTPQSIKGSTFRLTGKAARDNKVEFVIRRDISEVTGPGRQAFVTDSTADTKGYGTPVKVKEEGQSLTYRFSVPIDKVADSIFTLWGNGIRGEGVTFRFQLGQFWKPGLGADKEKDKDTEKDPEGATECRE